MAIKLALTVVDIDKESIIDVLEMLTEEIKQGMLTGNNQTTKEGQKCSYEYYLSPFNVT